MADRAAVFKIEKSPYLGNGLGLVYELWIGLGVTVRYCLRLRLARPGGLPLGSATHFCSYSASTNWSYILFVSVFSNDKQPLYAKFCAVREELVYYFTAGNSEFVNILQKADKQQNENLNSFNFYAPPCVADADIIFLPWGFFLLSSSFFLA